MSEIVREIALVVGLGGSSVGMTGLVTAADRPTRSLGIATIVAGVATLVASRIIT